MVDPRKQLARTTNRSAVNQDDEFGMLLARKPGKQSARGSSARARLVLHLCLLIVGLIGTGSCLWAMLYTSHSEEVAENLGLHRVANSLENILSLLAFPVLMFSVILTLYAAQQLYLLHREVSQLTSSRRLRRR